MLAVATDLASPLEYKLTCSESVIVEPSIAAIKQGAKTFQDDQ